jgi:hypothetical protein
MPKRAGQARLKMIEQMLEQAPVEDIVHELDFRERVDRERKELTVGKMISSGQVKRGIAKRRKSAGLQAPE